MATKSRIRWNAEEQMAVIAAARELAAAGRKMTADQRLAKAQAVLPKNRRRPANANLSSWLSKSVRAGAPAAKSAAVVVKAAGTPAVAVPSASSMTQVLVDAGIAIVKGILADKDVQRAFRQALAK